MVLMLVACLGVAAFAMAAGGDDDGSTTEAILRDVEAASKKEVAGELVARSRGALERGARMRTAGDEAHARLADSLARSWAEAARDTVRAAVVEESAAIARRSTSDAGALADRERALLEEAIAQSGRLRAQMEANEREGKEQPARTSAAANSDAGTKAPKPAPIKPSDNKDRVAPGPDRAPTVTPSPNANPAPGAAKDGGAR
jgi:hypothetical protein